MADVDPNIRGDCDDELKQALLAAFGDDALELLDDDDEVPDEMLDAALAELNADVPASDGGNRQAADDFIFSDRLIPNEKDSSRYRWAKDLYRAIYAPNTVAGVQNNSPLKQTAAHSLQNRFVVFAIGVQQFAIPLQDVREIARNPKITELPRTASWLRGVTSLRGQILSVTDLRNLLQLSDPRPNVGEKIIVIRCRRQSVVTALVVDRIVGIRTNPNDLSDRIELNHRMAAIANGSATFEQSMTVVIDSEKLFGCPELMAYAELNSTVGMKPHVI